MKHILITHEFAPFQGGVATYCEELAAAGVRQGGDVQVWAPQGKDAWDDAVFPFPVQRLTGGGSLRLGDLWSLSRAISSRRRQWENAFVWLSSVGSQMVLMHLQLGGILPSRFGVIVHGSEMPRFHHNPWLQGLSRRLFVRAERLAGASPFAQQQLQDSNLIPPLAKVELACCGLRLAFRERAITATPLSRADGRLAVLALGRLHPRKGQQETARALVQLPENWKRQIVFVVAGRGDPAYLAAVQAICDEGGVTLEYHGGVSGDHLDRLYRECAIFAQPSLSLKTSVEGLGMTNLEAAAYGKPVVGYDSGGVRDAVISGQTGLLVAEGDATALAQAVRTLLEDSDLRERLGRAGREHALRFGFEAAAQTLFGGRP